LLITETPSNLFLLIFQVIIVFFARYLVFIVVGALALPRVWEVL
jgi:branched-subunit amino acid transport protein